MCELKRRNRYKSVAYTNDSRNFSCIYFVTILPLSFLNWLDKNEGFLPIAFDLVDKDKLLCKLKLICSIVSRRKIYIIHTWSIIIWYKCSSTLCKVEITFILFTTGREL